MTIITSATPQLKTILEKYSMFLPRASWPWVTMTLAAFCQFFAWFGGRYLFPTATLFPRIIYLWLIAFIEYFVLIPGIGASVEILKMSESTLAIIIHAIQLCVFFVINRYTLKAAFTVKHAIAFALMLVAIVVAVL